MKHGTLWTLVLFAALSPLVTAQSQRPPATAATPRLTFEVASIKRNVSGDPGASIRVQPGGQITVTNNSLYNLPQAAPGLATALRCLPPYRNSSVLNWRRRGPQSRCWSSIRLNAQPKTKP